MTILPDEALDVPAVSMKSTASQSSSSGWLGYSPWAPKSAGVRDEAGAEEDLPEAVHGDARGERVLAHRHPLGEAEAIGRRVRRAAAAGRRACRRSTFSVGCE